MRRNQALNLYRRGKYNHLLTGRSGYLLSFIPSKDAVWYRTPKVGSRSIDAMLSEHFSDYLYGGHECAIPERKLNGLFRFGFVRNPVGRLVSLHRNKVINTNELRVSESLREELRDFNAFIEWVAGHDLTKCDGHWRLQTHLLDCERMDFIGRLETFDSDWNALVHQLGWNMSRPLVKKNPSRAQHDEVNADQIRRITTLYREDFEAFYPNELGR